MDKRRRGTDPREHCAARAEAHAGCGRSMATPQAASTAQRSLGRPIRRRRVGSICDHISQVVKILHCLWTNQYRSLSTYVASVALLDIDSFKQVNDTCGHAAGDAVLRVIGAILRSEMRRGDVVGRYGGEEFVLLLPGTDDAVVRHVAERIRTAVATHDVRAEEHRLSLSVWASRPCREPRSTFLRCSNGRIRRSMRQNRPVVTVCGRRACALNRERQRPPMQTRLLAAQQSRRTEAIALLPPHDDNATIRSRRVAPNESTGDTARVAELDTVSPVAWQHITVHGRYACTRSPTPIAIDGMAAALRKQSPETPIRFRLVYLFAGMCKNPQYSPAESMSGQGPAVRDVTTNHRN